MSGIERYFAFISYAHHDRAWADWLHSRLENYRLPRAVRLDQAGQRPLRPIFRDRDELTASPALGDALSAAIAGSRNLIVICSPAAARSKWVNEEIQSFRRLHGHERIFAFIVAGEPGSADDNCLPPALTAPLIAGGAPCEPICADARKQADGRRFAFLKLVAGMLGIGLDELVRRDQARRQRRLAVMAAASMAGTVAMAGLAVYANTQRLEAVLQRQTAETNERRAEATVDFLVDTFEVANPATENARTITAFTILQRGAARIETSLAAEPEVQVRLNAALGAIYLNLGLHPQAETLFETNEGLVRPGSVPALRNKLALARTRYIRGDLDEALTIVNRTAKAAERLYSENSGLNALVHDLRGLILRAQFRLEPALQESLQAGRLYAAAGERRAQLDAMSMAGGTESLLGRYKDADRTLKQALFMATDLNGKDHRDTGFAYNALAFNALEGGRADIALKWADKNIAVWRHVLGADHPLVATALTMKGRALAALAREEEADAAFGEAADILARAYPDGHYETGFAKVYQANMRSLEGRNAEALALLNQAKHQYDLSYAGPHPNYGDLEANRAVVLFAAGRTSEARAACRKAAEIMHQTLPGDLHNFNTVMSLCRKRGLY